MLRKIDCVMLQVPDVTAAAAYYTRTFGLSRLWEDSTSIGLGMPETDAEIVLHNDPALPGAQPHYLVDDVETACADLTRQGCAILTPPFDIAIGRCAAVTDPFGATIRILDMTKGPRTPPPRP